MFKSFPLLLGLQTMSDLNLSTQHRTAIVRDEDGRPFRLYPKRAIPKLLPSLAILSRLWQSEARQAPVVQTVGANKPISKIAPSFPKVAAKRAVVRMTGKSETMERPPVDPPARAQSIPAKVRKRPSLPGPKAQNSPRYWSSQKLIHAEREGNIPKFRWLVTHYMDEVQRFILRRQVTTSVFSLPGGGFGV